jgi:hypothetical protein
MRRREFLPAELPPPGCWPRAQHGAMPVIGFLNAAFARAYARPLAAFLKGLGEAGYVDGRNVQSNTAGRRAKMTDCRHCRPTGEKLPALAWNRDPREIKTHHRAHSAGAQSGLGKKPAESQAFRPTLRHLAIVAL